MAEEKKGLSLVLYRFLSKAGVRALEKMFPEHFQSEPLAPSDRYLEYHFALSNLPPKPARVLDIGCSGSFFPLLLAGLGYESVGVDIRDYPITNKLSFENFSFVKSDAKKMPFSDGDFDCVTAISVIEHIGIGGRYGIKSEPDADIEVVWELKRILKKGGTLIVTIPVGKNKIMEPYMRVYDGRRIEQLAQGLRLQEERYYLRDNSGDWVGVKKQQVFDIQPKPDRYPLALLKLIKP